ncbi:FAR1 DNA-binding domain [Sesbania bispinosa]|nr:FAR1 DNA-binding domain [Sesbania bispinosa]
MRGLHLGSKGHVVGKETDYVQQGSCPFVLEDDEGGVYVVDENWGNSCAVEGVEHSGGAHLSDNNGAFGEGYFCDGDNGGVFLVGKDWNDENLEGDGDNGGEDKILVDTNDDILKMGDLSLFSPHEIERYEFGSVDIAYKFYFEYGFANGFGIRKGRTLKNKKTLEEYQKEIMCCRAGQREDRGLKMEDRVREPRALTRCDCKARFHVRVNMLSGRWFCICFEDEHNHDRLGAVHCSMLPVYRKMSESDVVQMNNMMKVGIRPPNIFNTFANQSGGYEKIGFRKKDMYNKISEQRRSLCSDAKGALEYLGLLGLNFTKGFEDCMLGYYDVGTFRRKWLELVAKCELQENTWVAALYEKRNMWATAYLRGNFLVVLELRHGVRDCIRNLASADEGTEFECKWYFTGCSMYYIFSSQPNRKEWGMKVCVLAHLRIDDIPEMLVLKRWSKVAKDGLGCKEFEANHCVDVARRARKAALDGLYDHVSDFKSASIEKFKVERDRLVEDWRQCRADFESEQQLGLGGPKHMMVQGTQHVLQPKVMLVVPHLQASELGKNKIVPYWL